MIIPRANLQIPNSRVHHMTRLTSPHTLLMVVYGCTSCHS